MMSYLHVMRDFLISKLSRAERVMHRQSSPLFGNIADTEKPCRPLTIQHAHRLLFTWSLEFLILFFGPKVIINRWKELACFGLMHSMATSLFFWFWMVRNETVDSLRHYQLLNDQQEFSSMPYLINLMHPGSTTLRLSLIPAARAASLIWRRWIGASSLFLFLLSSVFLFCTSYCLGYGEWMMWNVSSVFTGTPEKCTSGGDFSALILHVSPYLYPFSIEYSILVGNLHRANLMWMSLKLKGIDTFQWGFGSSCGKTSARHISGISIISKWGRATIWWSMPTASTPIGVYLLDSLWWWPSSWAS